MTGESPPGPPQPRAARASPIYRLLRTGAPVLPIVLGGTHELYRGRRFRLQVLPSVTARALAGLAADAAMPDPWSRTEREAAHRIVAALHALTAEPIASAHQATELPMGARKRWRWLTTTWH